MGSAVQGLGAIASIGAVIPGPWQPYMAVASVGLGVLGSMEARDAYRQSGEGDARLIQMGYDNQLADAQAQVGLAKDQAAHGYKMAEAVMQLAHQRYQIATQQADYLGARGDAALAMGKSLKKQYFQQGDVEMALGHRRGFAEIDQGKAIESTGTAMAAAGGMMASDVVPMLAEVKADAKYNALMQLWQGDTARDQKRYEGKVALWEGQVAHIAADYEAAITMAEAQYSLDEAGIIAEDYRHQAQHAIASAQLNLDSIIRQGPTAAATAAQVRADGRRQGNIALGNGLSGLNYQAGYDGIKSIYNTWNPQPTQGTRGRAN